MGSRFTIQELNRANGTPGERFDWYPDKRVSGVDTDSADSAGGAFACPEKGWEIGLTQRTARTDYTGATSPSEQILGPKYESQTFQGTFDDRHNYPGFAEEEMRRLEAFVARGNSATVQFQDQSFRGVFTNVTFGYDLRARRTYNLTFSVHGRTEDYNPKRVPVVERSPSEIYDEMFLKFLAMDALQEAKNRPTNSLGQDTLQLVEDGVDVVSKRTDETGDTINQLVVPLEAESFQTTPYKRMATSFRNSQQANYALLAVFSDLKSSEALLYQTPFGVLDFEIWSRGTTHHARLMMADANKAAAQLEARDEPHAQRLYRPQAGESLYSIAWRFYGTPYAWQLIYERNNLDSFELDGTELLIIPGRNPG